MSIHKIKVLLSKGWFCVMYCITFMVFSIISSFSSAKSLSQDKDLNKKIQESGDSIKLNVPVQSDITLDSIKKKIPEPARTIKMKEFEGLMYGPPRIDENDINYEFEIIVK